MQEIVTHPTVEPEAKALAPVSEPIPVETFGACIHVEWNPQAAVTPLGQLPFFVDFLHVNGLFESWVPLCPLSWTSPNASSKAANMRPLNIARRVCGPC